MYMKDTKTNSKLVYVLTVFNKEHQEIIGVYSSEEKANKALDFKNFPDWALSNISCVSVSIAEYVLDM